MARTFAAQTSAALTWWGAELTGALMRGADLRGADLSSARLARADLTRASLESCLVGGAVLGGTYLVDLDLGPLLNASPEPVHQAPSVVDYTTLLSSVRHPRLKPFPFRAGMPGVFVEYMIDCARSMTELDIRRMLQSTFLSYGQPDEASARRLHEAVMSDNSVAVLLRCPVVVVQDAFQALPSAHGA